MEIKPGKILKGMLCGLSLAALSLSAQAQVHCVMPPVPGTPADPAYQDSVAKAEYAVRPVTSVYSLEIGGVRDLSTYLSPLYYRGSSFAASGSWSKAFQRWPDRCVMRFEGAMELQRMLNPAKTARMLAMTGRFNWGLMWRHKFLRDWQFTLGPMVDLYGGALYLMRNGNNPVTALASLGLDVAGSVSYRFKVGRLPVEVADEVRIPSLSGFFCPGFGESYYEIYLGNRKNLAHFGWWGNAMGVDNLLSVKLNLGKTGLMLGYRFDLRTFQANHLKTELLRNAFVIGVIPNSKGKW